MEEEWRERLAEIDRAAGAAQEALDKIRADLDVSGLLESYDDALELREKAEAVVGGYKAYFLAAGEPLREEAPIYGLMREREERDGITTATKADRLTYAVAGVLNECPDRLTLAALESPGNVEALAMQYPEVREHYPAAGEDAEEVRRFAAASLRETLES